MHKTFKYRLYPTTAQQRLLERPLEECRWLYNPLLAARAARRAAGEQRQASGRRYEQHATLPARKAHRPALAGVQSPGLQQVAVRIARAFQACFRRSQAGEHPGAPRFRGEGRSESRTFPQVPVGCKLAAGTPAVPVMHGGRLTLLSQRPVEGPPKTATIRRRSPGTWSGAFSGECPEPAPLPETGQPVGIDGGLKTFAACSTGETIAHPRVFRQQEKALANAQRRLSHAEQGTPARAARRHVVARVDERSAWRRGDFTLTQQHSRRIVAAFDLIAVEDLSVNRLVHNHCLAKSMHAAAWSQCADLRSYKAAWGAGRR